MVAQTDPSVADYLKARFVDEPAFAAACGVSVGTLRAWTDAGLVSQPAYDIDAQGVMRSHVFGAIHAPGAPAGRWFNPQATAWVARAGDALAAHGGHAPQAACALREQFGSAYRHALHALHARLGALPGFTDGQGRFDDVAFERDIGAVWEHFLAGTYQLCVAEPRDEAHIAEKEVVQALLTQLTGNGSRRDYRPAEQAQVRALIARYVQVSMPFSPAEYARSSRKRLVDDLLPHLQDAA